MAHRLGTFLAHSTEGNLESIELSYSGRIAEAKTELVRNSLIAGLLANSEVVNRINAAAIASERGIRIHERKHESASGGAGSILKVTLHAQGGEATASATVLHGNSPRLLACDGIDIEAPLEGTLLFIRNRDVPGVIGRIGTILGEHSVNIANFSLGRSRKDYGSSPAPALAVIHADGKIDAAVLDALRKVDAITQVRVIELDHE
jgi:D-3-phosphoglycerate dehydrogenase